jgi:hypothetical protein
MSTFYTFLLASQPKSALNDHGNKDIGDKLVHKSTNAKDQERDFCQTSHHVSIATHREQQD